MAVKAYALITLTDCYDGTDGTVHSPTAPSDKLSYGLIQLIIF
mgnify:CR=1 FL=1